jgi:hypothetical protein
LTNSNPNLALAYLTSLDYLNYSITLFAKHLAFDVVGTKTVTDSLKDFAGLFELD